MPPKASDWSDGIQPIGGGCCQSPLHKMSSRQGHTHRTSDSITAAAKPLVTLLLPLVNSVHIRHCPMPLVQPTSPMIPTMVCTDSLATVVHRLLVAQHHIMWGQIQTAIASPLLPWIPFWGEFLQDRCLDYGPLLTFAPWGVTHAIKVLWQKNTK